MDQMKILSKITGIVQAKVAVQQLNLEKEQTTEFSNYFDKKILELIEFNGEDFEFIKNGKPSKVICGICDDEFSEKGLPIHIGRIHKDRSNNETETESQESEKVTCLKCRRKFHAKGIGPHMRTHGEQKKTNSKSEPDQPEKSNGKADKTLTLKIVQPKSLIEVILDYLEQHPNSSSDQIYDNIDDYSGRKSKRDLHSTLTYLVKSKFIQSDEAKDPSYRLSSVKEFDRDETQLARSETPLYENYILSEAAA